MTPLGGGFSTPSEHRRWGNSRLPHSLAATEGPVAAAAPHLAVSRVIRGSWCALRSPRFERRVKILRPPPGARASLDRRCCGAQDDISLFFRVRCRLG